MVDALEELFVFSTLLGRWLAWEAVPSAGPIRAAHLASVEKLDVVELAGIPFLSGLARAVDWLRSRVGTTRAALGRMREEARSRAFSVAGLFRTATVEAVKESLAKSVEKGDTLETWREIALPEITGTRGITSAHAETIYRTVYQSTRQAAMLEEFESPDLATWIVGYRNHTMRDDRTSEICKGIASALGTKVLRADDPQVRKWWPPRHFNCRCMYIPVDRLEAKDQDIRWYSGTLPGEPAPGFEGPPSALA